MAEAPESLVGKSREERMNNDEIKHLKSLLESFIAYEREPTSYTRTYYRWKKFWSTAYFVQKELAIKKGKVNILDVGCGLGSNLLCLNRLYNQDNRLTCRGIDLDPAKIFYCDIKKKMFKEENMTFEVGDINSLNFSDSSLDIITCQEVVEHLKDPQKALGELFRILKPGGIAVITTPNESSLILKFSRFVKGLKPGALKKSGTVEDKNTGVEAKKLEVGYGHISVFSFKKWLEVFRASGFKVEKIRKGSALAGGSNWDKRRLVFALSLLAEVILDCLPILGNFSEDVIVCLRKETPK